MHDVNSSIRVNLPQMSFFAHVLRCTSFSSISHQRVDDLGKKTALHIDRVFFVAVASGLLYLEASIPPDMRWWNDEV